MKQVNVLQANGQVHHTSDQTLDASEVVKMSVKSKIPIQDFSRQRFITHCT